MTLSTKGPLRLIERLAGVKIIPKWRLADYPLARHLEHLFDTHGITTVLDVGANAGQYGRFLREQVGFGGEILSFEPDPASFERLQASAGGDRHWHCFPHALGDEESETQMNLMRDAVFNSLLAPREDQPFDQNRIRDRITIQVRTLDGMWQALQGEFDLSSAYLKMDTQGYDLKVLRGAQGSLPRLKALQTELSFIGIYEGTPGYREVMDYLEERGFRLSNMQPVNIDPAGRLIEADGVFVNGAQTGG